MKVFTVHDVFKIARFTDAPCIIHIGVIRNLCAICVYTVYTVTSCTATRTHLNVEPPIQHKNNGYCLGTHKLGITLM